MKQPFNPRLFLRRFPIWSWLWFVLGALYFILPLYATLDFSLRMKRGAISLQAYSSAFSDPQFFQTFLYSNEMAIATIIISLVLIVPTCYWIRLRVPGRCRIVEFITLMPFVIPAIILVFGLIGIYGAPINIPFTSINLLKPLTESDFGTNALLAAGYIVLAMPYIYRAVDTGLQAMNMRALTEAAQSLGANWLTIMIRIIFPNLRSALLSGALLTFAIVVGEVTISSFLNGPAFGPYLWLLGQHLSYQPAALLFFSFLLTWAAMGLIQLITGGQGQTSGAH